MNDLNKKREVDPGEYERSTNTSYAPGEGYSKKLGTYLLLLYQVYLKKETRLEADIKMALLRMVTFNKEYALKIRMMQLDYLNRETPVLDGEWDEGNDILFPIDELHTLESVSDQLANTIKDYKKEVSTLLQSAL